MATNPLSSLRSKSKIAQKDLRYLNDLQAAMQHETHRGRFWTIWLIVAFVSVFLVWAYNSDIETVTSAQGRVIPVSREQVIQSLDPGVLQSMLVKEGDIVKKGQPLLQMDTTRTSAVYREVKSKADSLAAAAARLRSETRGTPLVFPAGLSKELQERERASYESRLNALNESLAGLKQAKVLLDREIAITEPMVAEGVMSEVELLRLKRQSSDLALQMTERRNKYRTDANTDLVRAEAELSQTLENLAARADPVNRSTIVAPVRGIIKNIRLTTVGGVVGVGQDILEIVPLDDTLLVEVYVRPADVAFLHPGLSALVKLSAYDFSTYGGLQGTVEYISPDTVQRNSSDPRRPAAVPGAPDEASYRVTVRTDKNTMTDKNGKTLPIIPGMTAQVDMRIGHKTVFQYLTKPLQRLKGAMHER